MRKRSVPPFKPLPMRTPGDGFGLPSPATIRRFLIGALIFLSAFMVLMWEVQILSEEQERLTTEETQCSPTP